MNQSFRQFGSHLSNNNDVKDNSASKSGGNAFN